MTPQSLPMRERELKRGRHARPGSGIRSLPMRERELKLRAHFGVVSPDGRSPCGSVN